ncbi:MAG: hypothetical protein LBR89_01130 [Holosporales bacterium]|nr:hypothetical protein [Holosporales bacterium]
MSTLIPSMFLFATKRPRFSKEEDALIREAVQAFGTKKWDDVAGRVPNRDARQCRDRWKHYLSGDVHAPITQEEGDLLWEKYEEFGRKWSILASCVPGRTNLDVKIYILKRLNRGDNMLRMVAPPPPATMARWPAAPPPGPILPATVAPHDEPSLYLSRQVDEVCERGSFDDIMQSFGY